MWFPHRLQTARLSHVSYHQENGQLQELGTNGGDNALWPCLEARCLRLLPCDGFGLSPGNALFAILLV